MAVKLRKKQKNKMQVVKKAAAVQPQNQAAAQAPESKFSIPNKKYTEATGRRKVATARVRIYEGQGDFVVNDMLVSEYFAGISNAASLYMKPFDLTGTKGKFAVTVTVTGSGIRAQLGAVVHGLSQALVKQNPECKIFLKGANLLTRDDRMKETRKIGMGGKARRKRQSPKR
jgi:small subunit ribosomal protein S9